MMLLFEYYQIVLINYKGAYLSFNRIDPMNFNQILSLSVYYIQNCTIGLKLCFDIIVPKGEITNTTLINKLIKHHIFIEQSLVKLNFLHN
jgi:hypothetical protein